LFEDKRRRLRLGDLPYPSEQNVFPEPLPNAVTWRLGPKAPAKVGAADSQRDGCLLNDDPPRRFAAASRGVLTLPGRRGSKLAISYSMQLKF